MNTVSSVQPVFFEGQYLGADDLAAIVGYFRTMGARRTLAAHSWGIAAGLDLAATEIAPGEFQISITPGVAIDGYGRLIVVTRPTELETEKLLGLASGLVRIWIRYDSQAVRAARPGFNTCGAEDAFERIEESFEIEVGDRNSVLDRQGGVTVAGAIVDDAREAAHSVNAAAPLHCDGSVPYQEFPVEDDSLWLVPVGLVSWLSANNSFQLLTADQLIEGRRFRRSFGTVAEDILAANGLLRLRDRATAFAPDIAAACAETATQATDYIVCEEVLTAREMIWLEGDTRLTGDMRLFGTRLEFRDEEGRDYVDRPEGPADASVPLFLERATNVHGGEDLRVALGPASDGPNRFTVGPASLTGDTICNLQLGSTAHFVVQDDGKLGVGTAQIPDSTLEAALTVRGVEGTTQVLDPDTGLTTDEAIWHVIHLEDAGGATRWEIDLWTDGQGLSFHQPGAAPGALYLAADGSTGLGTTAPEATLDILGTTSGSFSPLGTNMWLRAGGGDDAGRFWVEYGAQNAPLLVLSDMDDPPRIQFQQTGNAEDETSPDHVTWIGQIGSRSEDFGIIGDGQIGLGTTTPYADVTIDGTLGFKPGSDPLIYMFESGTSNADRMTLTHSPAFPEWGLCYQDIGDRFAFQASNASVPALAVEMGSLRVGVGTRTPRSELEVQGTVRLGATGDLFAPGAASNMRIVTGQVGTDGVPDRGADYTCVRIGTGRYQITFAPAFILTPFVVATSLGDLDNVVSVESLSSTTCLVRTFDASNVGVAEGEVNGAFMFIAMGAR